MSSSPADMHSKIVQLKDKMDGLVATSTVIAEDLDAILLDSYKLNSSSTNNKKDPSCSGNILSSIYITIIIF